MLMELQDHGFFLVVYAKISQQNNYCLHQHVTTAAEHLTLNFHGMTKC